MSEDTFKEYTHTVWNDVVAYLRDHSDIVGVALEFSDECPFCRISSVKDGQAYTSGEGEAQIKYIRNKQ